jgi:hypothetical protein
MIKKGCPISKGIIIESIAEPSDDTSVTTATGPILLILSNLTVQVIFFRTWVATYLISLSVNRCKRYGK